MKDPSIMTTREIVSEIKLLKERLHALAEEYDKRVETTYQATWDEE